MVQALPDQSPKNEAQPEEPTKVFMGMWRSLAAMDHFSPHSPVWETVRDEVFDSKGQERVEKEGNTFLMFALWSNKLEVAKGLHGLGCDPSRPNSRGLTVIQSLIRDISPYKVNRTPTYISNILTEMPCQWSVVDPQGKFFDSHSIRHAAGWAKNFLLMDMNFTTLPPHEINPILDFIAGPLDYKMLKLLSEEVLKDAQAHDDMIINQPGWKAQLAKKASVALMDIVPKHIKDQINKDVSAAPQPKM